MSTEVQYDESQLRVRVVNSLNGFVERIDGDTAYVTLTDENGGVLHGVCSAKELTTKGIRERRRFKFVMVSIGDTVQIDLEPIPDHELALEEEQAIADEIDHIIGNLDGDY